jgi:hypothetical protein
MERRNFSFVDQAGFDQILPDLLHSLVVADFGLVAQFLLSALRSEFSVEKIPWPIRVGVLQLDTQPASNPPGIFLPGCVVVDDGIFSPNRSRDG